MLSMTNCHWQSEIYNKPMYLEKKKVLNMKYYSIAV